MRTDQHTFQALKIEAHDQQISAKLTAVPMATLPTGDVTIEAHYSSVNFKDALAATGTGKIIRSLPRIGGIDVAGYVKDSTDNMFKPGDPVLVTGYGLGVDHDGGYAEYVRVPSEWVVRLPTELTPYKAMALGTAGFTVALCIGRLEDNGQTPEKGPFIITGASGGVGCLAIDILSHLGYEVVAVTGKVAEMDYLKTLGASEVLSRNDLPDISAPLGKGQWGGAIDNIGGQTLRWLTQTTCPWGNIVCVGLAGGSALQTTVMPFILRGISLIGVSSANCPTAYRHKLWQRLGSDLKPRHLDKIVRNQVTLNTINTVFEDMLAGRSVGRTVVKLRT